jgi:hypothetical protein
LGHNLYYLSWRELFSKCVKTKNIYIYAEAKVALDGSWKVILFFSYKTAPLDAY